MAFNQGVYDFFVANLNSPQTIIDAMIRLSVNVDQLSDAIGMPVSQVTNYFNNAGLQAPGMGYQEPGVDETAFIEQSLEPDAQAPASQPVSPQILTAVEEKVGQQPRESLALSKDFAESTAIALLPGLGDGLFDSQGNRHTSTFVKTYKVVNGQTVETPFTPQDVSSNDFIFFIGSKTGGENRERAAQSYRLQDGKLVALGEPAYYKGAQDIGFFEGMLRDGLPFIASVVPGLNVAIGAALGATSTVMAQALGNAVMNAALSVAAGAKPADALKNAAVSFGVSQLIPNLTGNQFIDNAIKAGATAQLTGGKVGDAIANSLIQTGAQAASQGLSITGDRVIDSGLVSAATSALQSQVTGADTGFSALQGFVSGANAALAQKPVTEIPGTSITIGGGATTGTVTGGTTQDTGAAVTPVSQTGNVIGGVVLQNNNDGTSLILTQDGGATNVTSVDDATGETFSPGSSVTVDTSSNTATATGTDTGATTGTQTTTGADTGVTTGADTAIDTGAATDVSTGVDTQTGTQTGVNTTTQKQTQTELDTGAQVTSELTSEDQLLQQIIKELEQPTVRETLEPPLIDPPPFTPPESVVETPPITVEQGLTVRPMTVRPMTVRPTVMPGSRVEETAQILPIRPGLSEGGAGDIEGTPEEEQQPAWNVRSLKLRRLLGI